MFCPMKVILICLFACLPNAQSQTCPNPVTGAVKGVVTCVTNGPVNDKLLGKFSKEDDPNYCSQKCFRDILCCDPDKPQGMVQLTVYTASNPTTGTAVDWDKKTDLLNSCSTVHYIAHGYFEDPLAVAWPGVLIKAILKADPKSCPILVNWNKGNAANYFQSIANVRIVGAIMAYSAKNWGIMSKTHMIGFSLGAHVVGEAAKWSKNNGGGKVPQCTGLDPAGPGYDGCGNSIRLNKGSCQLVQAFHTNAELTNTATGLGSYVKTGHCDMWINCGYEQKCVLDPTGSLSNFVMKRSQQSCLQSLTSAVAQNACSHYTAPKAYATLVGNSTVFPECTTCGKRDNILCSPTGDPKAGITMAIVGQKVICTSNMNKSFFVAYNRNVI